MMLNKEKVLAFLPHRDPFLFIDSVESIDIDDWEIGKGVIASKNIIGGKIVAHYLPHKELDIFKGHFPGRPVLPGVIQVEMMAQASSFIIFGLLQDPFAKNELELALIAVNDAKFRKPIFPEMDLKIITTCTRYRGNIMASHCQVFHANELMSEASIMASVKF